MNTEIDKLLSLTYEIEGLLLLLRDRGGESVAPHIRNLLAEKGNTLSSLLAGSGVKAVAQAAATEPVCPPVPVMADASEAVADSEIAKAAEIEEKEEADFVPAPVATPAPAPSPVPEPVYEVKPEPLPTPATFTTTRLDEAQAEEDEADTEAAEQEAAAAKSTPSIKSSEEAGAAMMKLLSINDQFRFRRELFGGSNTAMKAILAVVATMPTFDDAKRYVTEAQGMDPENEEVQYFLEIIAPYFDK